MELRGSLKNFPLPDIIQLIGMGRRSGVLTVSLEGDEKASIFFDAGEMIHAENGTLEGPPVIYKLFRSQDGFFQFTSGVKPPKRSIHADWMTIVMEAARRFDEEKQGRAEGEWDEEPREIVHKTVDTAQIKKKMAAILEKSFGRKAKKILEELEKVEESPEKLSEFCNKAEKYIFVFIDNRKAKEVAEEMRGLVKAEYF